MNHTHGTTGYSPFYLSYGYFPRTPRLVLSPLPTQRQTTDRQWASTLASRLKEAYYAAVTRDSQTKQRRVAGSTEDATPLHVGDTVMMHIPPRPGFPSKLQSRWQGPFIVVKCLQANTYHIKLASNFRKRYLRHRDQLRVHHSRPERLHPTQSETSTSQSGELLTTTVHPRQAEVPQPLSDLSESHADLQEVPQPSPLLRRPVNPEILPSNTETCEEDEGPTDQSSLDQPGPCTAPPLELRRGIRHADLLTDMALGNWTSKTMLASISHNGMHETGL